MRFEFTTAGRIMFGEGCLLDSIEAIHQLGKRALLVVGAHPDRLEFLGLRLKAAGTDCLIFPVEGEPSVERIGAGIQMARRERCDLVVGVGGGSALDAAKAIAALAVNPGEILDYLEVIGEGRPLEQPGLPIVAIPTTAGTGAEVTRNAVVRSPLHQLKVSLRSRFLLPRLAIVDPQATYSLPPHVSATTGLDALTQLIEAFVSHRANPVTDGFCREGLPRAARSIRLASQQPPTPAYPSPGTEISVSSEVKAARGNMALASLMSGLALANAGLGVVHGFAAPLGGLFGAPHGAVCAALLPGAMAVNVRALRSRAPSSEALRRYRIAATLLTGKEQATIEEGLRWVAKLCSDLQIPKLRTYRVPQDAIPGLIDQARQASSMKGNPIALTAAELETVLVRAW